jgi:hypothetical protein
MGGIEEHQLCQARARRSSPVFHRRYYQYRVFCESGKGHWQAENRHLDYTFGNDRDTTMSKNRE